MSNRRLESVRLDPRRFWPVTGEYAIASLGHWGGAIVYGGPLLVDHTSRERDAKLGRAKPR